MTTIRGHIIRLDPNNKQATYFKKACGVARLAYNWALSEKAKTKLSRLHLNISNIRKDFLHKLTTNLVKAYDVICLENLNIKGMVKNHKLSRSINDLGFYEFKRQLIYKANQWGKEVKEVDRFYPSSKTCHCCGFKVDELPLSIRNWICPNCNTMHDRDINASLNILANANKVLTIT